MAEKISIEEIEFVELQSKTDMKKRYNSCIRRLTNLAKRSPRVTKNKAETNKNN